MVEEKDKLKLLRDILLLDDRAVASAINQRIETITKTIEEREKLSEKVNPIIDEKLNTFITEIPATLGPTITETLKNQIENSKDEIVEALYPILGKMIKRYIRNEIKLLSENINKKVSSTFSFASFKRKMKSKMTGVKEGDLVVSELNSAQINEVFVIQKGSGILLGNYSNTTTLDKDMISGMLTAIKSFVEDAFKGGAQSLESIEYELYTIHIQNFHTYYIAVVVSGSYTQAFENALENKLLKMSESFTHKISSLKKEDVATILKATFEHGKLHK